MVIDDTWTCSCGNVNSEPFKCAACDAERDYFSDEKDYSTIFSPPTKKRTPKRKRTKPSVWEDFKEQEKAEK